MKLKQGNSSIYARSSEEVLLSHTQGFDPLFVPGISSVLARPTFGGNRGVAESVVVCTGGGGCRCRSMKGGGRWLFCWALRG